MNVYDYAIKMEQTSEKYYRGMAADCSDIGLKTILTMLADEEAKHYHALVQMKAGQSQNVQSKLLSRVKNVFAKMAAPVGKTCGVSQIDLYKKAQEMEKKNEEFYRQKAATEQDQAQELLLKMAREEQKHWVILEGIIEFVSRPEQWVVNAEWNKMEVY
jgi:rubrerythrin